MLQVVYEPFLYINEISVRNCNFEIKGCACDSALLTEILCSLVYCNLQGASCEIIMPAAFSAVS